MIRVSRLAALNAILRYAAAVLVATDSPCSPKCGNVLSSTSKTDTLCQESDLSASLGVIWSGCLNCESTSTYSTGSGTSTFSDLQAMLYNMRFAISTCLFNGTLGDSPCVTSRACGALLPAFEYDNLTATQSEYGYCSEWGTDSVSKCQDCLGALDNGHFLHNYVNILDGACKMLRPAGQTLTLEGSIFSSDIVNVTTPTPTAVLSSYGPSGPLSLGAIVGIAIGGAAALLAIVGCCIVINGKRKRKAYLRKREEQMKQWPTPHAASGGEMFETPISQRPLRNWDETPVSQRPLRTWDESPISVTTEHTYPRYFSPYSSQYNSPVSAIEGPGHQAPWPIEKTQNIGVALSPDSEHGSHYWGDQKGKDKMRGDVDEYQMQDNPGSGGGVNHYAPTRSAAPPMLGHPGYGRQHPSPPESLREDEYRSG